MEYLAETIKKYCLYNDDEIIGAAAKLILDNYQNRPRITRDYIFVEGEIPVCLIAHLDTVFDRPPEELYQDKQQYVMWSPQGAGFDDRAGVAIIDRIVEDGYRPSIIFTTGEEKGGTGARKLISDYPKLPFKLKPKFLIELDRMGFNDSVFYCCENSYFEEFINSYGFETGIGTFTDISILMPAWKICGVNLSVGYWDEHSRVERIDYDVTFQTLMKVEELLEVRHWQPNIVDMEFKFKKRKDIFNFYHTLNKDNKVKCICCDSDIDVNKAHSFYNGYMVSYACDSCYTKYF